MRISFSPMRRDDQLIVSKAGDILTVNGEQFDFSGLPDGATVPSVPSLWIVGPVECIDGEIHLTLILPHGPNPSPTIAFPEPVTVTEDGLIAIPQETEHVDA